VRADPCVLSHPPDNARPDKVQAFIRFVPLEAKLVSVNTAASGIV